jgi:hypothetical protein
VYLIATAERWTLMDGSRTSTRAPSAENRSDGGAAARVVDRLADAINRHDLEALVGCFDADVESRQPVHPDRVFTGSEQIRENWGLILEGVRLRISQAVREAVGS